MSEEDIKQFKLNVDPERHVDCTLESTGIYVRALSPKGRHMNVDIIRLDEESLRKWLKSHGGDNTYAEDVVCILLGHYIHKDKELDNDKD